MRIIKEMGIKEYKFASKSIDDDYKAGRLNRQDAFKEQTELKKSYQNGLVNRRISEGLQNSKTMEIK